MTTHHSRSCTIGAGLVLLTLLASLLLSTHIVSLTHAAPPTHVPLTQYSQYPLSTVGKLFITFPTNTSTMIYQPCTGTALVSLNGSVVDTAAHCFFDSQTGEKAAANHILFCPQYHNQIDRSRCWTGKQWLISPNFHWVANPTTEAATNDYGFLVVSPLNGHTLQAVVGGVQAISSTASSHPVTAYGYPDTSPYTGRELYSSTGQTALSVVQNGGTILTMPANGLHKGASGGPWFFTDAGTPYLIGHSSGAGSTWMYSPTLDGAWSSLLSQAEKFTVTS